MTNCITMIVRIHDKEQIKTRHINPDAIAVSRNERCIVLEICNGELTTYLTVECALELASQLVEETAKHDAAIRALRAAESPNSTSLHDDEMVARCAVHHLAWVMTDDVNPGCPGCNSDAKLADSAYGDSLDHGDVISRCAVHGEAWLVTEHDNPGCATCNANA